MLSFLQYFLNKKKKEEWERRRDTPYSHSAGDLALVECVVRFTKRRYLQRLSAAKW